MRRCTLLIAAIVTGAVAQAAAAQALDRSQRPVAPPPPPFRFPAQHAATLGNGLRIIVVEDHSLPVVAVRAVVGVDSLDDPAGKQGLYDLTAQMLREGSASLPADRIADSVIALGNEVGPFRFTTITPNFDRSLALMAAMLAHPAFPDSALGTAKAALSAAEQRQLEAAATVPRRVLFEKLFGAEHPVTRSVVAPPAEIASITRDDLARFHESYFRPNNTTLVVVGDVQPSRVIAAARSAFGDWKRGPVPTVVLPAAPASTPTTIYLIDRPNAPQTLTFVGALGPTRATPDYAALQVLAPILGATPASRMQQDLRERHSYYYSGRPFFIAWRPAPLPSTMYGSAPFSAAKTDSALAIWIGDMRAMREQPPTEQEMELARGFLTGALPAQIETDDGVAERVVFLVQNGLPQNFYDTYVKAVASVTPADVTEAAAKYLDASHLVIVVAGDRRLIEPALRAANIAPIVIVDAR